MTSDASRPVHQKGADMPAVFTGEEPLLVAKYAEGGIEPAAGALHPGATAGVAAVAAVVPLRERMKLLLKFSYAVFVLKKLRFHLLVLRLKIGVAGFLVECFGFNQRQLFSQDRRRAVFIDESLKRLEKLAKDSHGQFLSVFDTRRSRDV